MNNKLTISYKDRNSDQIKSDFYEAINNKDKEKFLKTLVSLFNSGNLKSLFKDDKRYISFWRNRVLKNQGLEGVRKFDENPAKSQVIGQFIKYVMEQRFEIPADKSVLWGVYLSSLAHKAGDGDYEKIAFGDVKDQKFKWNI